MPQDFLYGAGNWGRFPGVTAWTARLFAPSGGGGGGDTSGAGGGGGGGCYADKAYTGQTADSYAYDAGSPGNAGSGTSDGTDGTNAFFASLVAAAGKKGLSGANGGTGGAGGLVANCSGYDTAFAGGTGGNGNEGGGGCGGIAGNTGAGGNGGNGTSGVGGGGAGGTKGSGSSAANEGIDGGGGADEDTDAPSQGGGGGGKDLGGGDHSGFAGTQKDSFIDYDDPIIDVATQPGNGSSGATMGTFTGRIKTSAGVADTSASACITRGNTCTITLNILTGSGYIDTGNTTRAYGHGADGSKADFDDIVVIGGGTFTFTITDDQTGVTVVTNSFTIASNAVIPPFLLRKIRRKKAPPYNYGKNAVRHVIIPTGTRPVPITRARRDIVQQPRTRRCLVPINKIVTNSTLLPLPPKLKRAVEPRTQRRTAIVPGAVSERPIPLQRFRGQRVETRSARRFTPLPGKQTTPVILSKTKSLPPTTRRQRGIATVPTLSQATLLPIPGKTRTRIVNRGRRVIAQFPAPLRNVPILMQPRRRFIEVNRRQRSIVPLAVRSPGLPIPFRRARTERAITRMQKRIVPLTLPARQTPVPVAGKTRRVVESRRQRSIATVPVRIAALPIIVARRQAARSIVSTRTKFRSVPAGAATRPIPIVRRSVVTRQSSIVKWRRFPAAATAGGGLVISRKSVRLAPRPATKTILRPLPVASLTVSRPVVVPGRRRTQTVVVRRSAVKIVPAGAGARNVVVHTTKKTW